MTASTAAEFTVRTERSVKMYPKLAINLKKLNDNLNAVAAITKRGGCSLMIVTKGLCADHEMVKMIAANENVDFVADSRVKNIATFADVVRGAGKKTVLLRIPMHCEVADVIKYVDLSFNSELSTIRLLNEEAGKAGKKRYLGFRPHVRGVVMNPIDHPMGGGEGRSSGGGHPVSPWGQLAKGKKTRCPRKNSKRFIVERRKK